MCRGPQAEDQICDSGPQCFSTNINEEEARKTGIWALCLSLSTDDDVSFNAHLRMAWWSPNSFLLKNNIIYLHKYLFSAPI